MDLHKQLTKLFSSRKGVNRRMWLDIDASRQEIWVSGRKGRAPPLLIVQAGPGLPLLNEAPRFRQLLDFEKDFTVCYWDQRGCGRAASGDVDTLSLDRQIADVRHMIALLHTVSGQKVHVLGISMGATYSLIAAQSMGDAIASVTAIAPDVDIHAGDAAVADRLQRINDQQADRALSKRLAKLGPLPYVTAQKFQARAQILTDLGLIEYGKRFGDLLLILLGSLLQGYGLGGAFRAIGNLGRVQNRLLPPIDDINLMGDLDTLQAPVHFVLGEHDAFIADAVVGYLETLTASGPHSLTFVPNAAHMAHFDAPAEVAAIVRSRVQA